MIKKKFNKKLTFTALVGLGMFTGLVGCGNSTTTDNAIQLVTEVSEPVQIDFWHNMAGSMGETLSDIVDEFNDTVGAEKGIEVKETYQGGYTESKPKITASLKAGNSPEIVQGTVTDIMDYINSGYVQNLDEYIFNGEIGLYGENSLDDIYEAYRNESKSYTSDGSYYSLPFAKSTDLLFYNKSFFDEHGLTVPTTWEEVVEVSKQITEITGKASFSIDNTPNYLISMLQQLGADYTTSDGEILFNNPDALAMLELIKEQTENGNWRLAGEDKFSSGPFLAETVHMYIGSSAGESFLHTEAFEWATAKVPQWDTENQKHIQQGSSVAILNQNKTSDEVFGAYEFIKYLISPDVNEKWTMETGYLPIRKSVVETEEMQEYISNSRTKQNAIESIEDAFVEPVFSTGTISSGLVRDKVGEMVDNVVLGGLEPQTALDQYESELKNY